MDKPNVTIAFVLLFSSESDKSFLITFVIRKLILFDRQGYRLACSDLCR